MKRLVSLLLIFILCFSLCSCGNSSNSETPAESKMQNTPAAEPGELMTGWKLDYYVDDFKELTSKWYIINEEPIKGTFDNSAVQDAELSVLFLLDEEVISIMLYLYGDTLETNAFYDHDIGYTVKMRLPDGTDYETFGFMYGGRDVAGDRIYIESPGKEFIINTLNEHKNIKFSIQDKSNEFNAYRFNVQSSNFAEVYESVARKDLAAEPIKSNAPERDKGQDRKQDKYKTAISAEEKGYYTIAKNIFGEILDYSDAQEHYNQLSSILQKYDGTYYGELLPDRLVKAYLYIKDGIVKADIEAEGSTPLDYELYLYGESDDGTPLFAFSRSRTELFSIAEDIT